ncbi:MAG: hypothetical protein AAGE52_07265 [Myxococcota bacterium]
MGRVCLIGMLTIGAMACKGDDCVSDCSTVARRCGADPAQCGEFCELRGEFAGRSGCTLEEETANACAASSASCGDALALVCAEEDMAYFNCGVAYCRANSGDPFCVALCSEDPIFCP